MMDNRIALQSGYEIDHDNNMIRITGEAGRGANCIIYDAVYTDRIEMEHGIRIKECYPIHLFITRMKDNGLTVPENEFQKYEDAKGCFVRSYKKSVSIKNTLGLANSTVNHSDIFERNNTVYTVMSLDEGIDYRKYEDSSLKELFEHIKCLSELIYKYHQNGYLHLDIKPENIFILPETREHVLLFDFDTVMSYEELTQNSKYGLLFSDGFSAPEQVRGRIDKIGNHTDIYSIGALVFYKLFNRKPAFEDCKISSIYHFEKMAYVSEKYRPRLYKAIDLFLRKTISFSNVCRWTDMRQVIDQLDELIGLSDVEGMYLIDSFQYNSACFVGRNNELNEIKDILENKQLVFLSGMGGIGKTELAKQYAYRYRDQYDTINFFIYEENIEMLVCDKIMINKMSRDDNESDNEFFKRKINILKQIGTPRDLIIIDNFDVDSDKRLEELFACPCKFIITTRMDFRDYDYDQVNIDRIEDLDDILSLFYTYNDTVYSEKEEEAVKDLIDHVEYHTMTVELIAKYLRNSKESPVSLYERFQETAGVTNLEEIDVKQRKDCQLRSESINNHLSILFDISGFDRAEKEIISSLSLLAGIRIKKIKFMELCQVEKIENKLDCLIRNGWIEYDDLSEKISLHRVIQDLMYRNLKPDAEKCPGIVEGMSKYVSSDAANHSESKIRQKVFGVFMERLSGENLPYARLCLKYGKKDKLDEAEAICLDNGMEEAFDILQKIYRKKIKNVGECNDGPASETGGGDHWVRQLGLISEMLDKVILYCGKSSDRPDHIVKEYIEAGIEVDNVLAYMAWDSYEKVPELDAIYFKIIKMLDIAAEKLPDTSYSAIEKEELYEKIQAFYLGEDYCAMYRSTFFSDLEKANQYQELIEKLRESGSREDGTNGIEYIWADNMSCGRLAEEYEREGNYEKAIEYYQRDYEKGNATYDETMHNIALIYMKMGNIDMANDYLVQGLDQNSNSYYSGYICIQLIRNLIERKDFERAGRYAKELIDHMEPDTVRDDDSYSVTYVLSAYYFLYLLEETEKGKEELWEKCLKYYEILGDAKINDAIFDFVMEYLEKENNSFEMVIRVIDRINEYHGKGIREKMIHQAIEKYHGKKDFEKYHVIFLLKLAEVLNELPYENIKSSLQSCVQAEEYYKKYKLKDKYLQNLIYKIKAEIMANDKDYEYEQVKEVRRQCDFKLLAERQIAAEDCEEKKRMDIWEKAADQYRLTDDHDMEAVCLGQVLEIAKPMLNQDKFGEFEDKYWYIMERLIRVHINRKAFESAYLTVNELYYITIVYLADSNDAGRTREEIQKVKQIAEHFLELSRNADASRAYLAALYLALVKETDLKILTDRDDIDGNIRQIFEEISVQMDKEANADMADSLIELKEEIQRHLDSCLPREIFVPIIIKISDRYQHQEIEFKRE